MKSTNGDCFHASHRGRRAAFTLVELLVVMGIILLLVAILVPTLGRARSQAKTTQCAANLHQIYVGATAWAADRQPDRVNAVGWMEQTLPYVKDKQIFQCTASDVQLESLDAAAATTTTVTPTAPTPTAPVSNSPFPPYSSAFVRIDSGSAVWDVPIAEGPWFHKSNATANSYDLWLEDAGFMGGGDQDFLDVGLRVTDLGNGMTTITVLARPPGKMSTYNSAVLSNTGSGDRTLLANMYKSGAQAGARTIVQTPPPQSSGSGGSGSSGSGTTTTTTTPGNAIAADYALNIRADVIYGNAKKVYAMDYNWSVADPAADNWSQPRWLVGSTQRLTFARHMWQANVLFADGSVQLTPVSTTSINPGFDTNRATFWQE